MRPDQVGQLVDARVDQLVAGAHLQDPLHEVEIYSLYEQALRATLPVEPSSGQVRQAADLLQLSWWRAIKVKREVKPTLRALKRRGARLGLLSNAPYQPALMRGLLDRQGLSGYFDVILFSSEIGHRKPAAAAFATLLSELGTKADETWFVGDEAAADIEGARAAGLLPLLAPRQVAAESRPGTPALGSWADLVSRWEAASAPG